MGKAIGFRVQGSVVHWAVVTETEDAFIIEAADKFSPPRRVSEGEALTRVRGRVRLLLEEHQPDRGGIKYTEPRALGRTDAVRERARVEGVILQKLDEAGVRTHCGAFNSIGPRLRVDAPREYLARDEFRGVDWSDLSEHHREAIFVALAALVD